MGTLTLIVFGGGVVANTLLSRSKGENAGWLTITVGWAMAVMMGVFVAQSAGSAQADLNPAVTFAKYLLGIYAVPEMFKTMAAEMAGAFCGAVLVWLAYLPHWRATSSASLKLAVFATSPAIRHWPSNVLCEILATALLMVCLGAIFGSATQGQPAVGFGPYLVGMLVWGLGLSLGGPTGYALNPARDLGPRLAHAVLPIAGKGTSDWSYAWVPVVGPLVGAALGAMIWQNVFSSIV